MDIQTASPRSSKYWTPSDSRAASR
jgi:hypothetical protein